VAEVRESIKKKRGVVMASTMSNGPAKPRPGALKALVVLEGVFAFVGFMSGYGLLSSPSGEGLGLPLDLLENAPVSDYTLVGLWFVAFYGVLPALGAYGLWTKKRWRWTDPLNGWTGQNWAWTLTVALGIILLLWIGLELVFVGPLGGVGGALQVITTALGISVLVLATRPSVRASMKLDG
jgi:hypothetical protein